MKDRLFIGCMPTGWVFCDTAIEKHGDYLRVAYQNYGTLELEIDAPQSPLLPLVREIAAEHAATRGQPYAIAGNMTITLGRR